MRLRATDPFLPAVKPHLFAVSEDLDSRLLTNLVLVITRAEVQHADCEHLNRLRNMKVTLPFTYSGISHKRVEPYPSGSPARSLQAATSYEATRKAATDAPVLF